MSHAPQTKLRRHHKRQAPLPEAFALATLATAARDIRTEGQRRAAGKAARKVARLIARGEL